MLTSFLFCKKKRFYNNFFVNKFDYKIIFNMLQLQVKKFYIYLNNLLNRNKNISLNSYGLLLNSTSLSIEHIKVQELTFLPEYFLITAIFCLTLFGLFSLKTVVNDNNQFSVKFQYNNQVIFLSVFILICYLLLVYQQINLSELTLSSFNNSIINDSLAVVSKFIIGLSSIFYLLFITQYLKYQKLSNFEYCIVILTSIFGFLLLCCANDFITVYLAIELQGLAFYVLAAFKKSSNFSIESGVKYFVLGSLSTAFFLLGVTFVYGLSGSLFLTDLNDFFIWVFSTNSFFFSFESLSKALESFQVKTDVAETFSTTNLQISSDSLTLLKSKFCLSILDLEFLKPTFQYVSTKTNGLYEINLFNSVSEKMFEIYYQTNFTECMHQDLLQSNYVISSLCHFIAENDLQNALLELPFDFKDTQLTQHDFVNFKNNLLQVNYYEDIGVEKLYDFSIENLKSQNQSLNFSKLNSSLSVDRCFPDVYQLLKCCYFSEWVFSIVQFSEYLKFHDEFMTENILNDNFSEAFILIPNKFNLGLEQNIFIDLQSYMFSVISVVSLNSSLLEFFDANYLNDSTIFDFSFIILGMIIILLSLFFKLALAPFHLWSPDVYEGSPTSSTFFFMVISKLGIFVFLLRICYSSFYSFISYWQFYSIIVATVSIFIGAVAGLKQRKLKSLLTYSSINNMGFVLLAFSVGSFEGIQIKFYYLIVYIITSLCLFGIILNLRLKKKMYSEKQNRDLGDLALLQESNNVIAQNLAITLFSMAGLPPLVGFLAKLGVFKALTGVSLYFFSVINILFSVIATFYYLRIVKIIFFENLLVGNLYATINSKKVFLINLLSFFLGFFFISPMFLYLYSYKITLFLNKNFY
nr:NADH dehydrogenase subunit 2 [Navicula sp.]